jgi:hypothetical protein
MRVLHRALEIIFKVQRKRSNEKITRRKIDFPTYKTHFKKKNLFEPLIILDLITFLFLIHSKRFKMLYKCHLEFYKSSWDSNNNITTYKKVFECLKTRVL